MHIALRLLNDNISLRLLKVQYLMLKPALGCVNWFLQVVDMVDGEEKGQEAMEDTDYLVKNAITSLSHQAQVSEL